MGYQLIETIEVGAGGAASIEFTAIPQDGVDLVLLVSGKCDSANTDETLRVDINNDFDNQVGVHFRGTGTSVINGTGQGFKGKINGLGSTSANIWNNASLYFSNYTETGTKVFSSDNVTEENRSYAITHMGSYQYLGTLPITAITIAAGAGNIVQYSTVSLYKITAG